MQFLRLPFEERNEQKLETTFDATVSWCSNIAFLFKLFIIFIQVLPCICLYFPRFFSRPFVHLERSFLEALEGAETSNLNTMKFYWFVQHLVVELFSSLISPCGKSTCIKQINKRSWVNLLHTYQRYYQVSKYTHTQFHVHT